MKEKKARDENVHSDHGAILHNVKSFTMTVFQSFLLATLAKGQQAIVMALCPLCFRSSGRLSVRACMSASVNSSFKKLLLRNYRLDFYEISQECSLGGPLSNSSK